MTAVPESMENPFSSWTNQAIHAALTQLVNSLRSKKKADSLRELATQLHAEVSTRKASKTPDGPQRWLNKSEFLSVWLMALVSREPWPKDAGSII